MKRLLSRSGLIMLLLLPQLTSFSQRRKSAILRYDTTARSGRIVLTNGTELSGQIVFNDNDGILTLFDGEESRSFNSRSVVRASFLDEDLGRDRLFYSLEYSDPETGKTDAEFFEVLKELNTFVVLARIQRLTTGARKFVFMPQSPMLVDRSRSQPPELQAKQTQTIFFLNSDGQFEPYLNIVEKEVGYEYWDNNTTNTHVVNAGLFKKYTGTYFRQLVQYAKENSLSFKRKADIVTILEEYERLSGN